MLEDRTLEVSWNDNSNKRYLTCLLLHMNDSENHMLDIIQTVSSMNVSVDGINIMSKGERSIYELTCYVTGLDQLDKLIVALDKYSYIDKVERAIR
jgi:(p)ppGpp synthase/HD superfamily hydrolase